MFFPILSSPIRPASLPLPGFPKCIVPVAAAALLGLSTAAQSATYTWVPTGGGLLSWDNASAANNWGSGGLFPNAIGDVANVTNDIFFDPTIELNQTITLGVLNIGDANGTNIFTISAGTAGAFRFDNGIAAAEINQVATSFGDTISANVATVGDLNLTNNGFGSLNLLGSLSSAATSGTQKITVTAANVYISGDIGDGTTGGRIAFVQSGIGVTTLLGNNNTFTGGVTLNSGTLNLGSATALGAASSILTINGGSLGTADFQPIAITNNNTQVWAGDFEFNGNADLDLGTGAVTMTGNRSISSTNTALIIGGVISDGGNGFSLTKTGAGTLTLKNANTYSGATTISGGRLDIQHANALGTGTNVTVATGGTLQLQGDIAVSGKSLTLRGEGVANAGTLRNITGNNIWNGNITVDTAASGDIPASIVRIVSESGFFTINGNIETIGTSQFVLQGIGDGVVNGVISGTAPLTKSVSGSGTWTLTGTNTYTGNTTISNGTLQIGNGGTTGTLGSGNVAIASIGTLAFNRSDDVTITNGISGAGSLAKLGTGNLTLGANTTFTGITTIAGGTLTLGSASALGGSTLDYENLGGVLSFGTLTAATIGNLRGSQNLALTNSNAEPVTLTVGNAQSQTYSGALTGSGGLTKAGTGILTLAGTNTYTGATTVNAGTLQVGDGFTGTLAPGDVTIATAGTLAFNRNNDYTITGAISGTGTLSKLGDGNLTVGTDLTFTGTTVIAGGTLTLGTASALGSSTLNYNNQGGTLSFGTLTAATLGSLRGSQNLTLTNTNAAPVTLSVGNGQSQTYSGSLSGAGGLTKIGTAGLILTGTNTYTGTTTVSAGTLRIGDGSYSGSISGNVQNDATLAFSRANTLVYGGQISGTGTLVKLGSGTLVLTGSNTYTGATTVNNGTLLLDYSTSSSVLNSASALTLAGGTLYVKGASSGATAQTLGNLTMQPLSGSKIVIDPNGGSGTTLTLSNTWSFGTGSNAVHFDLSRGGTVLSNPVQTGNVITGTGGTIARATITGTDGRTYFATVADGAIAPQTALTPLAPDSNSATTNFNVSGHLVTTAAVRTGTLRIDTTQTAGSLDISGGNLTYDRVAILMDGANDFEIKRTNGTGTMANVVIHQFGTGTLTLSAPFAANGGFTKTGGGLIIGAMDSAGPSSVTITDGIYRIAKSTAVPSNVTTIAGGILELGHGDYIAALGSGMGQVRLTGNGGFSAFGATRVVNIGGAAAVMTWDDGNFLPSNSTFILSSTKSDATLDFRNPITLGAITRTVQVNDGSAEIDAQLSGALRGTGNLVKTGAGTLELSATNTFTGTTTLNEGTLIVNGSLVGSINVTRGTLQGNGDGFSSGVIGGALNVGDGVGNADSILSPGNGIGVMAANGILSLNSDAQFEFELDSSTSLFDLLTVNGISIAPGATFQAFDLALTSKPFTMGATFVVLDNISFEPITGFFANLPENGLFTAGVNTFRASYNGGTGNDLTLTVVPEPGSVGLLLAGLGAMLGLRPTRRRTTRA